MALPNPTDVMIRALEARVANLEKALQVSASQVVLQSGGAKIALSSVGNVQITGGHTTQLISGADTEIKAAGHLILKGSTIEQN